MKQEDFLHLEKMMNFLSSHFYKKMHGRMYRHSLKKEIMVYGLLVRKNNELEMEVSSKDQIINYQL